jgi:hypothetical protein
MPGQLLGCTQDGSTSPLHLSLSLICFVAYLYPYLLIRFPLSSSPLIYFSFPHFRLLEIGSPGFDYQKGQEISLFALGPTQPLIQWVP